ncbi:MAG: hypothetical protein DRG24_03615 [Epsilonproteobacteria bacterium]|nr:MAG: hypothetical protein DRG24_03615 [Campylobacterota bacterium]
MSACAYVSPEVRKKQEVVDLIIELEQLSDDKELGSERSYAIIQELSRHILDDDILNFYKDKSQDT